MDKHNIFDLKSECSSDLSETQSEHEAHVYSIIHHNDFSGTAGVPSIDPKYGVELNSNGEVIVFLKDLSDTPSNQANYPLNILSNVCNNSGVTIPIINVDGDDIKSPKSTTTTVINSEFAETSLKKKKRKKKKKKIHLNDESIEEYIEIVRTTNALKEYKEISGLNKIKPTSSNTGEMALNVSLNENERGMPMTSSEILRQYSIGKPTECSLRYRCPKTWTPEMIKYYTKIRKSKRNFDCKNVIRKIKEKYGSNPADWSLNPMDLHKSPSNKTIKCYICKKFGHTGKFCEDRYKPENCIMCGLEGHNFHECNEQCCLSCGKWQKNFISNCSACLSKSKVVCSMCKTVGHDLSLCTESWRQFHSTISTAPEDNEFAQSTSKLNCEVNLRQSTKRKSETLTRPSTPEVREISNKSSKTDNSVTKSPKRAKLLKSVQLSNEKSSKNKNNVTIPDEESINIDVNIQDVTMERTLTKKHFIKKKKT